ncbi:MAG: hypothetical protein AAF500_01780 [Myxococcota bacterium]
MNGPRTTSPKPRVLLPLLLSLVVAGACGDSETTEATRSLIQWEAGDLDPNGCVFRVPGPWVSEEIHQESCSEGCDPVRVDDMFAACVSIPGYPPEVALDAINCLTHPVTRQQFEFPSSAGAFMQAVCWGTCENREPPDLGIPDECFEED